MKGYRKVLIAVNGGTDVLRQGLELAAEERCWVTVVKIVPPFEGDLNLVGIKKIEQILDSGAQKDMSGITAVAKAEKALVKARIEEGDVPQRIAEVAREERCDLIILGYHEEKGLAGFFKRLFAGNPLEKVIGLAPCPVLVLQG